MAAVLDALAPYVKKLIMDMAEEEVSKLLGISNEINKLGDKVESMEAYVADAERRRITDATVQRWVSKLKGALYEATDILELCQLDAEERRHVQEQGGCLATIETKAPGCLLPFLFCLRKPGFAHAMGGQIKDLNKKLADISQEMAGLQLQALNPSPIQTPPSEATAPSRTTTSLLDEAAIVGEAIEADTRTLVQELLMANDLQVMKVVSITAAGGMGKTTLAKKIFNDRDIQAEFRCRIWLSVTENYSPEKLLSSAVTQAKGGDNPHGDQQVLTQTLVDTLSAAGKFLLVLDDIWSNRPWTDMLQSPVIEASRRQPGSRVIITTRKDGIVKDMGANYHLHRVKPLSDKDAWTLLKKQLQPQQWHDVRAESALDHLKPIGMEIVRNCDGLPIAIKAIGGLLRTKGATEHEWMAVLHDPAWKFDKTQDDLNIALRLSYEDLPPQLKQCFLYLSLFPKKVFIAKEIAIGMWMSQGFLKVPGTSNAGQKEVEDVGMDYWKDLIRRNLIEANELYPNESVCQMHDVVRSFACYMAKEEALSVVGAGQISSLVSSSKLYHISIWPPELNSGSVVLPKWSSIPENQKCLRSLLIFGRMSFEPNSIDSSLSRFPSLRALLLNSDAETDRFSESLGKLKHLRFLSLSGTGISSLPDDVGNMKFLEHIILISCPSFDGQIPDSMLKLERLRLLVIGKDTKFNVPKGLSGLTNLRTLDTIPAQMDGEWCSLQELGPLCQLRNLTIACLEAVPSGLLAAEAKLCDKKQLRELVLLCYKFVLFASTGDEIIDMTHDKCQLMEEVVDQLCPPPALEALIIRNYLGRRPPGWMCAMATVSFNSLTNLDLGALPFCIQLPDGLCRLPSLQNLTVDSALAIRRVGPEFQRQTTARDSFVRTWSFPSLQFLRFQVLPEWEEWEWEEEAEAKDIIAMPSLQTLYIIQCKLLCLPDGLACSRRVALRDLFLLDVARIAVVENFPSVVQLEVTRCPSLKTIRGFPRMQIVSIKSCPALDVLESGPGLDIVEVEDPDMETLPEYLRGLKPRILQLDACHEKLRDLLLLSSPDDCSPADQYQAEMDKVKLKEGGKLVVLYKKDDRRFIYAGTRIILPQLFNLCFSCSTSPPPTCKKIARLSICWCVDDESESRGGPCNVLS